MTDQAVPRWRRRLALAGHRARTWTNRLIDRFESALQMRTIALALSLSIIAILAVGGYLAVQIRDGILTQRTTQILAETMISTAEAQQDFSASSATTSTELQALLFAQLGRLQQGSGSSRAVFLIRPPDTPIVATDYQIGWSDAAPWPMTEQMREQVRASDVQLMTYVAIPTASGTEPGLLVGRVINVPVAGRYELYFVYSLEPEQKVLDLVIRVLLLAGGILLLLIGAVTWLVTRQVVRPVQEAAATAQKIADGNLDERMGVRGKDEAAQLAVSINDMAESLQDQIERMAALSTAQRRFVSDVSHELRTPLTTVRMAADLLEDAKDEFPPSAARSAELMVAQLDRFEDLLADLLEISRFDAGAALLDAEERDIRSIVQRAIDGVLPLAQSKEVWLQANLPTMACAADVDGRRIERIVRNLLSNAIEHAEGNPVEVYVGADSVAVAVVVRDHGVGLSEEEQAHVFDRFWRADPARTRTTGGTGLGLSIALEDARLHGGWLDVWGEKGAGASFRLTLPRRAGITLVKSPLSMMGTATRTDAITGPIPVVTDPLSLPDVDTGPIPVVEEKA